jgi:hypothetical protein
LCSNLLNPLPPANGKAVIPRISRALGRYDLLHRDSVLRLGELGLVSGEGWCYFPVTNISMPERRTWNALYLVAFKRHFLPRKPSKINLFQIPVFIGITATSYVVAFVFTLAFEVPFILLQKLLVGREYKLINV